MRSSYVAAGIALAALALAGCGATSPAGPPAASAPAPAPLRVSTTTLLPRSAVPGMRATTRRIAEAAVAEATPIPGLRRTLRTLGLRGAAVREFTDVGGPLVHVVSRTVAFGTGRGASGYVRALVAGRDRYLGPGASAERLPRGWLLRQPPCGCHPQPPTLIALLHDGTRAHWLSITGPGATAARVRALALHLV